MIKIVNNLKINYSFLGEGRPLIILHGWGISSQKFLEFQRIFSREGFRVYLLDLPGFGLSDRPPRAWDVDDYVIFILSFSQKLNLEKFFLLGHSFGGRIAIKLAASYPEKLFGLILCASAGLRDQKILKRSIFLIIAKLGNFIFNLPLLINFKKLSQKLLYILAGEHDYEKTEGIMKETFKKVITEDLKQNLKQIKIPTLIIWGTQDKLTPIEDGKIMAREITQAEFRILEGANHKIPYEYLEESKNIILKFLKKN